MHSRMQHRPAPSRSRGALCVCLVLIAAVATISGPAAAQDRTHVVEWLQPEGPAAGGFLVELGTQPGTYTTAVDLGPVAPEADGVRRANLVLDAFTTYYLRLIAYNTAGGSPPSEEGMAPAMMCYPALCDDGNECTADVCDIDGCANPPLADGSSCSDGMCVAGSCEILECLADSECDDGNLCNGVEFCAADGLCGAGPPLSCGEPSACAAPACDPLLGCVDVPLPDGTSCDDGNKRTKADRCQSGVCVGILKSGGKQGGRGKRR